MPPLDFTGLWYTDKAVLVKVWAYHDLWIGARVIVYRVESYEPELVFDKDGCNHFVGKLMERKISPEDKRAIWVGEKNG